METPHQCSNLLILSFFIHFLHSNSRVACFILYFLNLSFISLFILSNLVISVSCVNTWASMIFMFEHKLHKWTLCVSNTPLTLSISLMTSSISFGVKFHEYSKGVFYYCGCRKQYEYRYCQYPRLGQR